MTYPILLPFSLAFTLLAYLLAPVLPLFARECFMLNSPEDGAIRNVGHCLPRWLWYFQTPDNPLEGDQGHKERWAGKSLYWQMVAWLVRNPAYGFEWDGPLCAKIGPNPVITTYGNPWIKNRHNAVAGWYFCRVDSYWNFRAVIPLFGDHAFMPEFGWKLGQWAQGRGVEGKAMYVFSIRFTAFYR